MRRKGKRSKRKSSARRSKQNILIVCEGKTEKIYLDALKDRLKLSTVNIKIEPNAGGHSRTIKKAETLRDKRKQDARQSGVLLEYDAVWCVFDAENPNRHIGNLENAVRDARQHGFQLAISNPSFEIWYLWHFSNTGRYFEDGQAVKRALREFIPGYKENMNVFSHIFQHTAIAMKRATQKSNRHDQNPSTYVYQLLCRAFFANQSFIGIKNRKDQRCLYGTGTERCKFCHEQIINKD